MQFTTGPFLAQRGLLAAEAPVEAASPPGTYTTATLGAEKEISSFFLAAFPTVTNHYQCNIRVDPAAPALRQSASFKTGSTESVMGFIWTTDGWSTANAHRQTGSGKGYGDPDTIWTNGGDLLLGAMDRVTNSAYKIRRVVGGGATVGAEIAATGVLVDYPHFHCDRTTGRIYVYGTNDARNGVSIGISDDGGLTWTKRSKGYTTGINRGFTSQGCTTANGTILLPQNTETTIINNNGTYGGSTKNCYALRSTDNAVTWTAVYAFSDNRPASNGPGGIVQPHNMWFHGGRVHWLKPNMSGSGAPELVYYGYSVDDGLTFTWNTTPFASPGSSFGVSQAWIGVQDGVLVANVVWIRLDFAFQYWSYYSFDNGVTWTGVPLFSGTYTENNIGARAPGVDQNWCDIVGNTAWFIWHDNRGGTASTPYKLYTRSLTFS